MPAVKREGRDAEPQRPTYHPFEIRPDGRTTLFVPGISCHHWWASPEEFKDPPGPSTHEDEDGEVLTVRYCFREGCKAACLLSPETGELVAYDNSVGLNI